MNHCRDCRHFQLWDDNPQTCYDYSGEVRVRVVVPGVWGNCALADENDKYYGEMGFGGPVPDDVLFVPWSGSDGWGGEGIHVRDDFGCVCWAAS